MDEQNKMNEQNLENFFEDAEKVNARLEPMTPLMVLARTVKRTIDEMTHRGQRSIIPIGEFDSNDVDDIVEVLKNKGYSVFRSKTTLSISAHRRIIRHNDPIILIQTVPIQVAELKTPRWMSLDNGRIDTLYPPRETVNFKREIAGVVDESSKKQRHTMYRYAPDGTKYQ